MKNLRILLVVAVALGVLTAVPVYAGHTGQQNVAATVTPAFVSVTVSTNSLGYGSQNLSAMAEPSGTPTGGTLTQQVCATGLVVLAATNNGSGFENFNIRGDNSFATGTTPPNTTGWTLGASATAAADIYEHRFTNSGGTVTGACDFAGTNSPNPAGVFDGALSTASQLLKEKVPVATPIPAFLRLGMPSDTTKGNTQQTMPVIIVATAS